MPLSNTGALSIERVSHISAETFVKEYIARNRPVIVTDAMNGWAAREKWTPQYFSNVLGDLETQVYNDLFDLVDIKTLAEYFADNFGPKAAGNPLEYVRWYSKLKEIDYFPWADEAFARLKNDWSMPYFLPRTGYVVPACRPPAELSSERSLFPYRGLFISGRGARTRLHRDPWTTAAVLCQFHGEKRLAMFAPEHERHLSDGRGGYLDVLRSGDAAPKPEPVVKPTYVDTLVPGEIVLIPGGWLHDAETLSDSISATWNFVHETQAAALEDYVAQHPDDSELEVMRFFSRTCSTS
ncbi:cupin-like domain-containing protein [Trinickia mobilis]|uniref:cupin-like domain-containing protein n=1 Tax=Trinickia mobilis TaxID=2816356 RepID=UPI001A8C5FD9|nr:cupin-like domain-containing protein [Trinickia mobilis]